MTHEELSSILLSDSPSLQLDTQREEVFQLIPELRPLLGMYQNSHHDYDGWTHTIKTVDGVRPDLCMRMTALLHDVGKPVTKAPHPKRPGDFQFVDHADVGAGIARHILERLGGWDAELSKICTLIELHVDPLYLALNGYAPRAVRRFLRKTANTLPDLLELAKADAMAKNITERNEAVLQPLLDALKAEHVVFRPPN